MSGKFVLQPVMSTCQRSARVSDKMESLPLKSRDVTLGKAIPPGSEWGSDTGMTSGSDVAPAKLLVLHVCLSPLLSKSVTLAPCV